MEETLGQGTENNSSTGSNLGLESHGEKMLRQSEVNDIVGRAKQEAASKAVENYRRSQLESAQHQQRDTHASSESISEVFSRTSLLSSMSRIFFFMDQNFKMNVVPLFSSLSNESVPFISSV